MMITDVIRQAASEEVYFLVNSYVEAVRYGDKLGRLPEPMRRLPIAGSDDLRHRTERLRDLCAAGPGHGGCEAEVVSEALEIFAAARGRLAALERESASTRAS